MTSNNVLIKHIGLFSEATAWLPAHVSMREHGRAVSGGRASPVIMKVKNDQININILIKIAEFAQVLFKQTGDSETVRQRRAVPHLRVRNPSQTGLSTCVEPI